MDKDIKNIEIVTTFIPANVVLGAKVFISTEDAKAILKCTNAAKELDSKATEEEQRDASNTQMEMLYYSRNLLRQFAKAVLYSPVNSDITLASIASKYL